MNAKINSVNNLTRRPESANVLNMNTTHTPDQLRDMARQKYQDAVDSFERCDTDGALSQWASGLAGDRLHKEADIAENGGLWEFPALFDTEGNLVPAKLIEGKYGMCWMLLDSDGDATGEFIGAFPARRSTMFKKGYLEGTVKRPARVKIGARKGGMATAYTMIVPADDVMDAPVEIVTTDNWAD